MKGPRLADPIRLADHDPTGPRPHTTTWTVGDVVQVGRVRWIIRILTDHKVELEAANVPAGIWWRTTLDHLPDKAA